MGKMLLALWRRLPVLVRAPLVAFAVLQVGSTISVLPLLGNLKILTNIPWALPATLLLMWAFWWYVSGHGIPEATRAYRAAMSRGTRLAAPQWRAVAPALIVALIASCSLRLLLPSLVAVAPPRLPIDVSAYPTVTVLGLAFALAASSAIVEEVAFRGYLQKSLEAAYGIVPALLLTGVAFWCAHADKVALSHLPFHLLVSVLLGSATYLTRSLLPAIAGHLLGDILLLPVYVYHRPEALWALLAAPPVWAAQSSASFAQRLDASLGALRPELLLAPAAQPLAVVAWVLVASLIAAVFALRHLARVAARTTVGRDPSRTTEPATHLP